MKTIVVLSLSALTATLLASCKTDEAPTRTTTTTETSSSVQRVPAPTTTVQTTAY